MIFELSMKSPASLGRGDIHPAGRGNNPLPRMMPRIRRLSLKKMYEKTGSTIVEASLIYPLIILIIAAFISLGRSFLSHVAADAERHADYAQSDIDYISEDVLRTSWYTK